VTNSFFNPNVKVMMTRIVVVVVGVAVVERDNNSRLR